MDVAINPSACAAATVANRDPAITPPPFIVVPARHSSPLVYAAPHSGRHYPSDLKADVDLFSLRRFEDTDVDLLIEAAPEHGATVVAGCYGRAYLDLNRAPDDLDPAMFDEPVPSAPRNVRIAAGLGLFARFASGGREIYNRKLSWREANHRLLRVHSPYHAQLTTELGKAQSRFGSAVLVDWHSMPSSSAFSGLGSNRSARDVVLGDRYGQACRAELVAFAETTLQSLGLSTARNSPYAGGYTTEHHGRPSQNRHALQIELNRALYLDEAQLTRTSNFTALRALVTEFTIRLTANLPALLN